MAASVTLLDGSPRFVWTDARPDADIYARVILASVLERQQWRSLYQTAKAFRMPVDSPFGNRAATLTHQTPRAV
jgi:hypothetical protein